MYRLSFRESGKSMNSIAIAIWQPTGYLELFFGYLITDAARNNRFFNYILSLDSVYVKTHFRDLALPFFSLNC